MKAYFSLPLLLSLIFCCGACKDTKQVKKEDDAMAEFKRAADEIKATQAREMEETGELKANPKAMDRMLEASKKLEEVSTGDDAKIAKVMRIFIQGVQSDMAEISKQQSNLAEGTNYANVKTAADINTLSDKVKIYQAVNTAITNKVKSGWTQSLRDNLEKEKVSKITAAEFMSGVKTGLDRNKPHLLVIRQTDSEICEALLAQHAVLKKHLGKWQWNAAEETPNFEGDAAIEAYNVQANIIQNASERQAEAQKNIVR